jgi:transcriptional regulator with XRE-family HTH domain
MVRGKQFRRRVDRAMAAADIPSLSELARRSGVQRDTLYAWFRGERAPKSDTLKKVADALGVRIGELWDYEPVMLPVAPVSPSGADLAAFRAMVAEAVELGVARALAQLGAGGSQPPRRRPRPQQ